jgi:hypothetical protein
MPLDPMSSSLVLSDDLAPRQVSDRIHFIRGQHVILDSDLAWMYGVETKALNKAVSRNANRFPEHFRFQLLPNEWSNLRFQSGTSSATHGGRRFLPFAFTEQGVAMLSAASIQKTHPSLPDRPSSPLPVVPRPRPRSYRFGPAGPRFQPVTFRPLTFSPRSSE